MGEVHGKARAKAGEIMVGRDRRPTHQRPKGGSPPVRQEGARGGQYWPPSQRKIEWEEKAIRGRKNDPIHPCAPLVTLPHPNKFRPMLGTAMYAIKKIATETAKGRNCASAPSGLNRANTGAPNAATPLVTPPHSPSPYGGDPSYLLTLDPITPGQTSPS